jgi:hypothetical protein
MNWLLPLKLWEEISRLFDVDLPLVQGFKVNCPESMAARVHAIGGVGPISAPTIPGFEKQEQEQEQKQEQEQEQVQSCRVASFLKPYMALRSTDVGSTRELLKMTTAHCCAFATLHYVSTLGVAQFTGRTNVSEELVFNTKRSTRLSWASWSAPGTPHACGDRWCCWRRPHARLGCPSWCAGRRMIQMVLHPHRKSYRVSCNTPALSVLFLCPTCVTEPAAASRT